MSMSFFRSKAAVQQESTAGEKEGSTATNDSGDTPVNGSVSSSRVIGNGHSNPDMPQSAQPTAAKTPFLAYMLGAVASIGGFMFGYESGQISGFLLMSDFLDRFGENGSFSATRSGAIVALLCAGTLIGCLLSPIMADSIGRKYSISASAFFYIIGVIIEITSATHWVQFAMGRLVAGLGIGALSTTVPMYQSESIPKAIRGAVVSSYQLLITLGIWTAYMVNYGTNTAYANSAQWRITVGLSALWAILLGTAVLFLPESPRFAYRQGKVEEARRTMSRLNGVSETDPLIDAEIREIEEKLHAERAGGTHPWYEIFTAPRMLYRTLLGMILQAGQQLTGANYFFYYGTTIFASVGLENPYVTSIILGSVNVVATLGGIYVGQKCGRRNSLMFGAAWMMICLFIFAFVGRYKVFGVSDAGSAGNVMVVFTCLFIAAFAMTWGPIAWAVVAELYPARHRAMGMALATAANWGTNLLISFFSTLIAHDIDYFYGLVFACSCGALVLIVYFFLVESQHRSLEEIDTMYLLRVDPRMSAMLDGEGLAGVGWEGLGMEGGAGWGQEGGEGLRQEGGQGLGEEGGVRVNTDQSYLTKGGRSKMEEGKREGVMVHDERFRGRSMTRV